MKGMKSEFRSFLPAFEKGTEVVPEPQADLDKVPTISQACAFTTRKLFLAHALLFMPLL